MRGAPPVSAATRPVKPRRGARALRARGRVVAIDARAESGYAQIAMSDCAGRDSEPPPIARGDVRSDIDRRSFERREVTWSVDCETEDTFLYAAITNISEMGIFVRTTEPLPVGTELTLRFAPPRPPLSAGPPPEPFVLRGTVQWINRVQPLGDNPNPGMGVKFIDLRPDDRERLVEAIRTIAYLRDDPTKN
jgi:type IV pilus assembly protein PilZ